MNVKIIASIGAIVVIILIILFFIRKESYSNENIERNDRNEIREDFPASAMKVLYSDASGNLSSTSDLGVNYLSVNNDISANGRIYFRNQGHSDNSDMYFLEKKNDSDDNNSLRLYINDNADESFQIWGNSCDGHDCKGDKGHMKHKFVANGDAQHMGALSAGSISTGGALSAGSISTGGALSVGSISTSGDAQIGGNLCVKRKRLGFSSADDLNHTIYNNLGNNDSEGVWDGMKMNVYAGLDVRTGNANDGAKPKTMLSIRDGSVSTSGSLSAGGGLSASGRDILSELNSLRGDINQIYKYIR